MRQLTKSALEAELKERGDAIHDKLELQRAAMEAIGSWLIDMKKTEQSLSEDREVNKPYAESGALPATVTGPLRTGAHQPIGDGQRRQVSTTDDTMKGEPHA